METAVPIRYIDRHASPDAFADAVVACADSGVVDHFASWDQLTSWRPPLLWNTDVTPRAAQMPDMDSWPDVLAMSAYALARAPGIGTAISIDALRRGPAELMQTMLTMANLTRGRSIFMIGAGEQKQAKPFGWKRTQGLKRLEDSLQIFRRFWDTEGPISFQGHFWELQEAWLGGAKPYRPRTWALGGGPKLLDLATSYADGFATMVPLVAASPEQWAEQVTSMKQDLERKGRDPEAFYFGVFSAHLIHEDPAVIDRALDNDLMRFDAAIMGRLNQADWAAEGVEPVFAANWHYARDLLPVSMTRSEVDTVLAGVTRSMTEKMWINGTPAEVAAKIQPYVDAGATWVQVIDSLPAVLPPEDAANTIPRCIEVCRILKGK